MLKVLKTPVLTYTFSHILILLQVVSDQAKRDKSIIKLCDAMARACEFADDAKFLRERSQQHDIIIGRILKQIIQCAFFIRSYCQEARVCKFRDQ